MSTLTITNQAKPVASCLTYEMTYSGSQQGDNGTVNYTDCDGVSRSAALTWEESDGRFYTITLCALSIDSLEGTVVDSTNYSNQESCAPIG